MYACPGIAVNLRDNLGNLDHRNITLVAVVGCLFPQGR
jgi:hypothetical protein